MRGIVEINLDSFDSKGGNLIFFQLDKEFNFILKRIYFIHSFKKNEKRGFHAHKKLKQVMFCPYGKIRFEFDNGKECQSYLLDTPNKILVIEKGYWREFMALEDNSILCVGASEIYDENDYIRDYQEYLKWEEQNNESTI